MPDLSTKKPKQEDAVDGSDLDTEKRSTKGQGPGPEHPPLTSAPFYKRWRPEYHFIPLQGWLNDPCGPLFDTRTGLYHLSFQWNPDSTDWHKISWGHATSRDMIHWDFDQEPILVPGDKTERPYDCEGVFSGCAVPRSIQLSKEEDQGQASGASKNEDVTIIYTSVSHLPINYHSKYRYGAETLSLCTYSKDTSGSFTCRYYKGNPILPGPPKHLQVTGWRDPFVAPWPVIDRLYGQEEGSALYGIISGGIRDITPTVFLYKIDKNDLSKWEFLGCLLDTGIHRYLGRWSGGLGINFEVSNFATLKVPPEFKDKGLEDLHIVLVGVEGISQDHLADGGYEPQVARSNRNCHWLHGSFSLKESPYMGEDGKAGPFMEYDIGGVLDYGCLYAANGFWDTSENRYVLWGWVQENDLSGWFRALQGWSGAISLPRELKMKVYNDVTKARVTPLKEMTCCKVIEGESGKNTIITVGIEPLKNTRVLREKANRLELEPRVLAGTGLAGVTSDVFLPVYSLQFEVECKFSVSESCAMIGFQVAYESDFAKHLLVAFYPKEERIVIDRSNMPKIDPNVNLAADYAPHTLFTYVDQTGEEREEQLKIKMFVDNSVVEVFVNGRTAITTRAFHGEEKGEGRGWGLRFLCEDYGGGENSLVAARVWEGLATRL